MISTNICSYFGDFRCGPPLGGIYEFLVVLQKNTENSVFYIHELYFCEKM